jgi:hypothetical protein
MSSIDNSLEGGGSASASGKKGVIQLSDGNFNLTSNKDLKSDPATGTITTTGLTTTGTVFAGTVSATSLIVDTLTESLTVVGDASITGDATVDGTISTTKVDISQTLTTAWATVSGTLTAVSITGTSASIAGEIEAGTLSSTGNAYFSSNVGIGTTDTAEYKFLVNDGTSNLFGVPLSSVNLAAGKTLVYDGSGWDYDNAGGIVDGTQSGEILVWGGSEWSANSAVVVEGTSVGIGSTQPTQKLDVIGSVKATDFIGSGDGIDDLNASNVTSGTLNNARLPGTISVSNLEATANLVVGGPADITGTLSASDFIGSGDGIDDLNASNVTSGTLNNARLPGTISVSNLEATANLVVGGPVDITGTLSVGGSLTGSSATVTGDIQGLNLTSTGTLSADGITSSDNVTITGADKSLTASNITTSNLTVSNFHSITGTLSASNVETSNLTVSNRLSGGTISVSNIEATANLVVGGPADITGTLSVGGSLTGASATVTGQLQGSTVSSTGHVIATGSLTGASATVTGQVQGATVSSTGHVIATGSVTGTTVNTPTLVVSKDAQITGNLTVSGGLVTITSTTTGTNQINITNNGTGPALIAKQTGDQPVVNFLDDSTSALFISGGELAGKDGFVGLGTETPQERLDVQGNIVSSGTISSTNVATSNLTVSNRLSGGTISVSNVEATANLVVGGPADIAGTLSAAGMTSSAAVNVTGTISSSSTVTGTDLVVSGTAQGLNLTSTGTLSAAGITSSENVTISGADKILTVSNISTSNLTVSNRLSGGTISVSNIEATANLVVGGPVDITGTLSAGAIDGSSLTVTGDVQGASASLGAIDGSSLTVTGDVQGASASLGAIDGSSLTVTGDVEGTSASLGAIDGSSLTVTGDVQGLNLTSTGTLSAAGITSSADTTVTGTLTATANIAAGGNVVATNNAYASFFFGDGGLLSNVSGGGSTPTLQEVTTEGSTTSDLVTVGGLSSTADVNVTGTLSASANLEIGTSNLFVDTATGNVGIGTNNPTSMLYVDGDIISNLSVQTKAVRISNTPESSLYFNPNLTVTGSLTAGGDVKSGTTFRGPDIVLSGTATVGTLTTSNITHDSELTITSNLLMGPGTTLTASNIVGGSPLTITSDENLQVNSNLTVGTSNLFVDTTTGNVAIGTTNPTSTLHVVGDAIFSEGSVIPAFNAYKNDDGGQVYDRTDYIWNTEYLDRLNNYDTTNGRFTAPSGGYYYFWASFEMYGTTSSPDVYKYAQFYKNGSVYTPTNAYTPVQYTGTSHQQLIIAHVIYLDANDYVTVRTHGTTRGMQTSFLGFKIGA